MAGRPKKETKEVVIENKEVVIENKEVVTGIIDTEKEELKARH